MMGWNGYQTGGTDWVVGLLIVFMVGFLIRMLWHGVGRGMLDRRNATGSRSALEQAEVRYARGEISRDEFLDMVNDLYLADSEFKRKRKRSEL
jgi:uncharacterized membrane protein